MLCRLFHVLILLWLPLSWARADTTPPDLVVLLEMIETPHQARDSVLQQLDAALPQFHPLAEPVRPELTDADLYFWSLEGRFGRPIAGTHAPGGLVTCARYGRLTLERLQELPSSDPRVFPLMRQAAILHDDASAWPEVAVARLVCQVTWDDGRRVAPLERTAVEQVLADRFAHVISTADPVERPGSVRVFGSGGYVIEGQGGPADMIRVVDRAEIRQVATHQLILLRSYLLGGGT